MRLIGNVEKDAQVRAVASGALPSGDAVIVNSDGTVSVVEETNVSQAVGSPTVFDTGGIDASTVFDSSTNKVVISYRDGSNSNYFTSIVGTVSGTTISFGTPTVISESNSSFSSAFDSSSNKVVVVFRDGSTQGGSLVGTVSGTSITFGTKVVFNAGATSVPFVVFDSASSKIVVAYEDGGNSSYGTAIVGTVSGTSISYGSEVVFRSAGVDHVAAVFDSTSGKVVIGYEDKGDNDDPGTAIVGTVSGTSISFGSSAVFESGRTSEISLAYDTNSEKVVISYKDENNSDYGTSVVGTVSGTSISFGTPVVFQAAASNDTSIVYDQNAQKVVIAYRLDSDNSGQVIVGTVSGTSISFGTPVEFEAATFFGGRNAAAYDANAKKVVISYRDSANSSSGTAVVFQNDGIDTNLTAENFLGFAAHTYADGQSAAINSTCTVDRNQSGLTAGQTYYVQTDGSLGTTAADPSVVAGTAISSTEIIVKG